MLLPSRDDNPSLAVKTGDERLLEALLWDGLLRQAGRSDADPLTQEELAEWTGLSRNSIKAYTSTKLRAVLGGDGSLALRPDAAYALGVDFGRTHEVRVVLTDLRGGWDEAGGMSPPEEAVNDEADPSAWETINTAVDRIWEVVSAHPDGPLDPRQLVGVGIGIPTPNVPGTDATDSAYGHWGRWGDPTEMLREALNRRWGEGTGSPSAWDGVHFEDENDTNLSAIADHLWGSGPSSRHSLFVKWQSSVRAALILDGRLYRGSDGVAGELPHVKVDEAAGECELDSCPAGDGCLYAIAPIQMLAKTAKTNRASEIVEMARHDATVRDALNKAAEGIGKGLAPLAIGLNPKKVVIGGALGARAYPLVLEALRKGVETQSRTNDFVVTRSTIRNRGTARGAAALALLRFGPAHLKRLALGSQSNGSQKPGRRPRPRKRAAAAAR